MEREPGNVRRGHRPAGGTPGPRSSTQPVRSFSAKGCDASSLGVIARLAEVDPALVHHYVQGKSHLFAETMSLPVRPDELIGAVLDGPRDQVGERLARALFLLWDAPRAGSASSRSCRCRMPWTPCARSRLRSMLQATWVAT
jgi:hypothetical protein